MSPVVITFCVGFLILVLFVWYLASAVERNKRILGTLLTIFVTALCVYSAFPPFDEFTTDKDGVKTRTVVGKIQQGIDLKGGMSWQIRLMPSADKDGNIKPITQAMVDQAIETFRKRVDDGGVSEPLIAPAGPYETGRRGRKVRRYESREDRKGGQAGIQNGSSKQPANGFWNRERHAGHGPGVRNQSSQARIEGQARE